MSSEDTLFQRNLEPGQSLRGHCCGVAAGSGHLAGEAGEPQLALGVKCALEGLSGRAGPAAPLHTTLLSGQAAVTLCLPFGAVVLAVVNDHLSSLLREPVSIQNGGSQ